MSDFIRCRQFSNNFDLMFVHYNCHSVIWDRCPPPGRNYFEHVMKFVRFLDFKSKWYCGKRAYAFLHLHQPLSKSVFVLDGRLRDCEIRCYTTGKTHETEKVHI